MHPGRSIASSDPLALALVIPAYKEQHRLPATLDRLEAMAREAELRVHVLVMPGEIPPNYADRKEELLFEAVFPSRRIGEIWDCARVEKSGTE